ncbi:hypothetical protein [Crateriforma conspicua]|uniref:hypothetical protein n=1 Tax=Crateriforma conspicua TaxID=2527996 RepID=UPI001188DFB0|nr:hypothetical protein [Crateriforma conspicua]QDV66281.1 hypothetical protein Mal65_54570 [Crateriforma conspicua]
MIRTSTLQIALIALAFCCGSDSFCQEMQIWKTKNGHSTSALFWELDEAAGTVTLLVPRRIDLDILDLQSVLQARRMDSASKAEKANRATDQTNAKIATRRVGKVESFVGEKRYILGIVVWGVGDFAFFDPSVVLPDDPDRQAATKRKYRVEKLPIKSEVTLLDRAKHPVSGSWVYQVQHAKGKFWVLEAELSTTPKSFAEFIRGE